MATSRHSCGRPARRFTPQRRNSRRSSKPSRRPLPNEAVVETKYAHEGRVARRSDDAHRAPRRAAHAHHPRAAGDGARHHRRARRLRPGAAIPHQAVRQTCAHARAPSSAPPTCSTSARSRASPHGCRSPPTAASSSPCRCIMWQVWRFIVPALHAKEKKYAIPFVASARSALFALGGVRRLLDARQGARVPDLLGRPRRRRPTSRSASTSAWSG